jgi:hypothetical protein
VSVLLGNGDGTFQTASVFSSSVIAGDDVAPIDVALADVNHDGWIDILVANGIAFDYRVSVLLGKGDGTFHASFGVFPLISDSDAATASKVRAVDQNGDELIDIVAWYGGINNGSDQAAWVSLQNEDGTFASPYRQPDMDRAVGWTDIDFNGDGRPDRVGVSSTTADDGSTLVVPRVLIGNGHGSFDRTPTDDVKFHFDSSYFTTVPVADVNRDGLPDLVGEAQVYLGQIDGTFQPGLNLDSIKSTPLPTIQTLVADLNGDGRLDVIQDNEYSFDLSQGGDIEIHLGNGDGSFSTAVARLDVARDMGTSYTHSPYLVVGDFNADGKLDLVTAVLKRGQFGANYAYTILAYLGNGDGTFQPPVATSLAKGIALDAGEYRVSDFNHDGSADLAVGFLDMFTSSREIHILLGLGDGRFRAASVFVIDPRGRTMLPRDVQGGVPQSLADLDGDGNLDFVYSSYISSDDEQRLLGTAFWARMGMADGTFGPPRKLAETASAISTSSYSLETLADVNDDEIPDLIARHADGASFVNDAIEVALGKLDGTFGEFVPVIKNLGRDTNLVAVTDVNADGNLDLVYTAKLILLGTGDGSFVKAGDINIAQHTTLARTDLDGDGVSDLMIVDQGGQILWRRGAAEVPGEFKSPIVLNPGHPVRDIAAIDTVNGKFLLAIDRDGERVSLFRWLNPSGPALAPRTPGALLEFGTLATGIYFTRLATGDIDGDGHTDLVVLDAAGGMIRFFRGDGQGSFLEAASLSVDSGASDIALLRTGRPDLVVTSSVDNLVRRFANQGGFAFAPAVPYQTSDVWYSQQKTADPATWVVYSVTTPDVAVGRFTAAESPGVVVMNRGYHSLGLLAGLADQGLVNVHRVLLDFQPAAMATGDFNGDGLLDVVVLGYARLAIFLSDGHGGLAPSWQTTVMTDAAGLSAADIDGDGLADLMVGGRFGDVLRLIGNGDGTFRPFQPRRAAIALAVSDLNGDGQDDFVFANAALERVSVEYGSSDQGVAGARVVRLRSDGLLAPGKVQLADLNGDGIKDMIIANSGSNNILVYPGLNNGQFGPPIAGKGGFAVGTNPTGFTVADLNGDGKPDLLVANTGSNDVSVLLGQGTGSSWTMASGARIKTDAGPVAVAVGNILGTGKADLAVANQQANDVQVFPGVGGGFFNDQNPTTYAVGQAPSGLFLGHFSGRGTEIAALNAGSNSVSLIGPGGVTQTIPTGGLRPSSGFAGDFNSNGFTDLVVGNNGDGRLSLLVGGSGGLSLAQTLTSPDAPSPTSLSFGGLSGGVLSFYVASAGREAATSLAFDLGGPGPEGTIPPDVPGTPLPPGGALSQAATGTFQQVAELLSLTGSALDLVATLLTVSVVPGATGGDLPGGSPGIAQGLGNAAHQDGSGDSELADAKADQAPVETDPESIERLPEWARFAMGLDGAWSNVRGDFRKSESVVPAPTNPAAPPSSAVEASPPAAPTDGLSVTSEGEPIEAADHQGIDSALEDLALEADAARPALWGIKTWAVAGTVIALTIGAERFRHQRARRVGATHQIIPI